MLVLRSARQTATMDVITAWLDEVKKLMAKKDPQLLNILLMRCFRDNAIQPCIESLRDYKLLETIITDVNADAASSDLGGLSTSLVGKYARNGMSRCKSCSLFATCRATYAARRPTQRHYDRHMRVRREAVALMDRDASRLARGVRESPRWRRRQARQQRR